MLAFKNWVVATLINDATLQSTSLKDSNNNMNVFPAGADIQPEQFPCIIYSDVGVSVLSRPQGMHVGNFQIDVWSIINDAEVETIYDRVAQLLNFKDSTTQSLTGTLWWIREANVKDTVDTIRRLWIKNVTLKYWYNKTNNS